MAQLELLAQLFRLPPAGATVAGRRAPHWGLESWSRLVALCRAARRSRSVSSALRARLAKEKKGAISSISTSVW